MRAGSLFSGIGGFDLGLERAGFTISWQVEIDPYCQRVLAKHWPNVTRYGDITAMDWTTVQPVDLLCGGFPCQDLSFAGKRAGIDGARSGLWSEYVRAIRHLRPRYVLVENVPGLLTNQYLGRVLGDLAQSGYDAEWDCIPASAVGAPHRRDRVWIVAYHQREQIDTERGVSECKWDGVGRDQQTAQQNDRTASNNGIGRQGADVADATINGQSRSGIARPGRNGFENGGTDVSHSASRCEQSSGSQCDERGFQNKTLRGLGYSRHWETEPAMGELVNGVSGGLVRFDGRVTQKCKDRIHKLRGLGNAIVPQIAEALGRMILARVRGA